MNIQPKFTPVLDPGFIAPVLWNKAFEDKVGQVQQILRTLCSEG